MGNFLKTQSIFSCGEVSPDFYAIDNSFGVSELENMDVLQSGGLKRRPGLKKIAQVSDNSILVPFIISEDEKYLLVIYEQSIDVYKNDTKITTLVAPWSDTDLPKLQYAQRFNTLFFVHPGYQPRILTKNTNSFKLSTFSFFINPDISINIPFTRFDDTADVSITISASNIDNNHAVFTTNKDMWSNAWVGVRLFIHNKQWIIDSVQNARSAIAYTNGAFSLPQNPLYNWTEAVFSNMRGWPVSVSFHQNRLVFGGSPSAPNNIWMSKTGQYNDFDVGTGLDDEAIFVSLLSGQHNHISTVISSDTLQILTSVGEWAISNSPLTPSNVNIKQHTSVGSIITRYLPPQQIEGSTVFISKSGQDIRELDMDVLKQTYNATDLCCCAKHLMNNPVSIAYNPTEHRLYIVMENGRMAVLNKYTNTEISAWGTYTTDGVFKYVTVIDEKTYVVVKRQNTCFLENFDSDCLKDSDNYNFSYKVSALPLIVNGHAPKKLRIRKIKLRLKNTKTVFINNKRVEIPNDVYDEDSDGYNGDLSLSLIGYQYDTMQPLWSISSNESLPATVLSVTTDGWYSI
jgi:hypothetical protein